MVYDTDDIMDMAGGSAGGLNYSALLEGLMGAGGAIGGGLLTQDAYQKLGDIGTSAQEQMTALGQEQLEQTAFRPYSVTTATGADFGVDEAGSINQQLSEQEMAQYNQLMGAASGLFGQAAAPSAQVEQQVFDRMMALQSPAAERERAALENRLRAQGRLGTSSSLYGGTSPDMLGFQTAQAEARNAAALQAMQQARADQLQAANLGTAMQGAAYLPQAQALAAFQPSLTTSGLAQQGQLQGANLYGESVASGLGTALGAAQGQANLIGNLGASMLGGSMATASGEDGWVSAIGDVLGSIFD